MIKRFSSFLLIFFSLVSCASFGNVVKPNSNDKLDGWIGKNVNDLYICWGIPTRKQESNDLLLLEYNYHEQETTESYTTGGYWVGSGRNRSYILPTYHPEVTKDFYCQITFVIQNDTVSKYILHGEPNIIDLNVKEPDGFTENFYEVQLQKIASTWQNKNVKNVIQTFGKNYKEENENNQTRLIFTKSFKYKNHIYTCNLTFVIENDLVCSLNYDGDMEAKCKFVKPCLK